MPPPRPGAPRSRGVPVASAPASLAGGPRRPPTRPGRPGRPATARAPSPRSAAATASTSAGSGGVHSTRRSASGDRRFSTGTGCACGQVGDVARACGEAGRRPPGRGRPRRAAGGGPSARRVSGGSSASGRRERPADGGEPLPLVAPGARRGRAVAQVGRRCGRPRWPARQAGVGEHPAGGDVALAGDRGRGPATARGPARRRGGCGCGACRRCAATARPAAGGPWNAGEGVELLRGPLRLALRRPGRRPRASRSSTSTSTSRAA